MAAVIMLCTYFLQRYEIKVKRHALFGEKTILTEITKSNYLAEGIHDEGPLAHEGVGDGETRGGETEVVVEQDVNVYGTVVVDGATGGRCQAFGGVFATLAEAELNILCASQDGKGREAGLHANDGIDERVGRLEAPGLGTMKG